MSQCISTHALYLSRRLACSCAPLALAMAGAGVAHAAAPSADPAATAPAATQGSDSGDIIVSAQRHDESLSKVPLSIASYTQKQMDQQGIRTINDLARLTPALTFTPTSGVTGNNGSNISIRGLKSDVGSATTAIYIDDTPIQIRNVGYYGGNPYPRVFDLERVEVLRGPQGTLYGASAEGGAVRFITPEPNFDKLTVYSRSQVSFTKNGAPSYEAGLAIGGPISDTVAVRASGWYQHSGGYIDQVSPSTGALKQKDVNYSNTFVGRVALAWKPTPNFTLTPKLYYQTTYQNARDDYWEGYGNASSANYQTGVYQLEPSNDHFLLPSLAAQLQLGNVTLVSNSSYLKRNQDQQLNYATYFSFLRSGSPFGTYTNKDLDNTNDYLTVSQRNFTQELRAQSYGNRLIDWSAGVYFARTKQYFTNYTGSGRIPGVLVNGYQQYDGLYSYVDLVSANDTQLAGYGSVDIKPTDKLKLTAALRYTWDKFDYSETKDGPTNAGVRSTAGSTTKQGAWTPKFGIQYQLTGNAMGYVSATKGFRPAGAQSSTFSDLCAGDLATLGMSSVPSSYKSDSLWSYEMGTKAKLLNGLINVDLNGYLLKWKNIQQSIRLPTCSFSFISNLGNATGRGMEAALELHPAHGFTLGANLGYTNLTYDQNIYGGNGLLLRAKGQRINGPLWSGHVYSTVEKPVTPNVTGYLRVDYSFTSDNTTPTVSGTYGYDAGLYALSATNYLQMRLGARFGGMDASVFVDNLTNSHDVLARNHDGTGGTLYYDESYRPRTIGLTLQYRY